MRTCITWDNWHADSKQTIQQDRKIHLLVAAIFSVMWWDVIVSHVTSDRVKTWVGHGHYPGVPVWHFNEQDISNRNNLTFCCIVHIMTKFCELLEFNTKIPNLRGRAIKLKQTQTMQRVSDILIIYVPAQTNYFYTNTVSIQTT